MKDNIGSQLLIKAFALIDLVEEPQDNGSFSRHPEVVGPHPNTKILIFTKEEP
jgi:hypothetical protein